MPVFRGMTKTKFKIACAPLAIAAMAALHTAPAAAQAQPQIVIDVPDATTTTTEPTIVLPAPEPVVAEPVVIEPAPSQADPAPVVTTTPEPQIPATASTRVERSESASSTAITNTTEPVAAIATASDEASVTGPATLPAATLPAATDAEIAVNRAGLEAVPATYADASGAALLLALLGVGGIGLLAFFLMRRRKRVAAPTIERPVVTGRHVDAAPVLDRDPVVTAYDHAPRPLASATASPAIATPAMRSNGAAVELPQQVPATFEGRSNLLMRMVNARPDRANPFTSPKARVKRARLIMQSIGTSFRDRKPLIDLSQYTNIWPELRGWKPATA